MKKGLLFSLVGPGAVGKALARALVNAGWHCAGVFGSGRHTALDRRFAHSIRADYFTAPRQLSGLEFKLQEPLIIVMAVREPVISALQPHFLRHDLDWSRVSVLHCSGPSDHSLLAGFGQAGAGIAACHPFQTFPADQPQVSLRGVTFGIDGNAKGLAAARQLAHAVGGNPLVVRGTQRKLYHAAAVITSGLVAANLTMALKVLHSIGVSERRALAALLPIAQETIRNAGELGVMGALTGPAVRGDSRRILDQMVELERLDPGIEAVYADTSAWLYRLLGHELEEES
ncbi:DUF2520 domain-containing protein [candidate division KSB1 bacterium]|nr:DUF2520 domain-containing protein [candidate division KSB1 bacterium]